ncbi:MAG TPA: recombinase family protein [Pseudonocardiaceae bacterium]|nr:recombinase family protein [Pseudonocardiaceae bacterium]
MAIEEEPAEVVRRIFAEYLAGRGNRAIANGLNRDGIPCPSAHRRDQNSHRLADGWQGSTTRAILENPRYTGYAIFGRWTKHEVLLDPDDVAAGHVVRFRRAAPERVVRSRRPAHPAIVSVEDFTQAQLLRRSKGAGGLSTARKSERSERPLSRPYVFRGRIRHVECARKMEASPRKHGMYYRCPARTLAPGSAALASHPPAVYLREDKLQEGVTAWLAGLFAPRNMDRTVAALVASQGEPAGTLGSRDAVKKRLADAEAKLRRLRAAIEAGVDPVALVESINAAQAQREVAQAELEGIPAPNAIEAAEIYARIDSLGDVGAVVADGEPQEVMDLYAALDLQIQFDHHAHTADVIIKPVRRVNSECVRGGT